MSEAGGTARRGLKTAWSVLTETFSKWNEHKAPRLAAALAYFTLFSMAPVLIVAIAIAGLVFGRTVAEGEIARSIAVAVGAESAQLIQGLIASASRPGVGIVATGFGLVTILLGSAGLFFQLKDALNTVWEVTPKPNYGLVDVLRDNGLSFAMVLGIGLLLLGSLMLSATVSVLSSFLGNALPGRETVWRLANLSLTFGLMAVLFALLLKILPDVRVQWRDVWMGAFLTAGLLTLATLALGIVFERASPGLAFGAAGSLVVILVWVNIASLVFLFGAEFTRVYSRRFVSQAQPEAHAVALTAEARAVQGIPARETVAAIARESQAEEAGQAARPPRRRRLSTVAIGAGVGTASLLVLQLAAVVFGLLRLRGLYGSLKRAGNRIMRARDGMDE